MTTKITLYSDKDFNGRHLGTTHAIENLKNYGFNDTTTSCKIEGNSWILYKDSNFQGDCSILQQGDYANSGSLGIGNDSLSSLRPFPEVEGPTILLFKDSNYRGRMVVLTGALSNFKSIDFNDQVSSAIVLNGSWELCQDKDFGGNKWVVSPNGGSNKNGRYPHADPFCQDCISSAKPV